MHVPEKSSLAFDEGNIDDDSVLDDVGGSGVVGI